MQKFILLILSAWLLMACSEQQSGPEVPAAGSTAADSSLPVTDAWIGKWTGPEGTFLDIAGGKGAYRLVIQNLDGPTGFEGTAQGNRITFDRNGKVEFIRATDGPGTGMKWLATKKDCLVINPSEGFCRD